MFERDAGILHTNEVQKHKYIIIVKQWQIRIQVLFLQKD